METKQREALRAHIQQSIEQLSGQLPSLRESSKPVPPDNALGRLTRLDAIQVKEMNESTYRSVQAQLASLNSALNRIEHPNFGLCSECENPIPLGRLKVMPGSSRCVDCA